MQLHLYKHYAILCHRALSSTIARKLKHIMMVIISIRHTNERKQFRQVLRVECTAYINPHRPYCIVCERTLECTLLCFRA